MLVTLIFGGNQGDRKALIGEVLPFTKPPRGDSNHLILFIIKLLLTKQIYFQKKFWINVRPQNKNSDESAPVLSSVPEPWI